MTQGITAVEGIRVGHASDCDACTGCTVILCEGGAVGGVDVRGWASGTRELDALGSHHLVAEIHGVLLAGGSAFGLDAAAGVMRYLEDRGFGLATGWVEGDVNLVGQVGTEMVMHAVLRAVKTATSLGGLPACRDLHP